MISEESINDSHDEDFCQHDQNMDSLMQKNKSISNTQKNGVFSLDDYHKNYCFVCPFCTRRYSSITGLNYHLNSFNHKNPPKNYDPHRISKRGRPRGYRPKSHYNTCRTQQLDSSSFIQHEDYTSRSGRRVSRPQIGIKNHNLVKNQKKLTYAESQRVVEIEQNNHYYRISVDEKLETVKGDDDTFTTTHQKNGIKRPDSIPKPVFIVLDPYNLSKFHPNPILNRDTYIQSMELFENEDSMVEYVMDEEDVAWVNEMSKSYESLNDDTFEFVMDKLEKESEFRVKNPDGTSPTSPDEDVVCAVCLDGDCTNTNLIVFCDICNMAVHQDCYGLPYVPEGQWLCRRCSHAPSKQIECVLCPVKSGVFKQTVNNLWCHIICAIMIPGVKFINSVFLEPIDISDVSPTRFDVRCRLCNCNKGAVIQCVQSQCTYSFHPSCAQTSGLLYIEKTELPNSEDNGPLQFDHRYLSFCPKHHPVHKDRPEVISRLPNIILNRSPRPKATIHVPVVSEEILDKLANQLTVPDPLKLVKLIKRYWQIKRYLRSGVPLLRRRSYIPKHPASSFKITEKQLYSLDKPDEAFVKIKILKNYLKGFEGLLELVHHRECLKSTRTSYDKNLYKSLLSFDKFLTELSSDIRHTFKKANERISLKKSALIKLFRNNFQMLTITSINDFGDFLFKLFNQKYGEQLNTKTLEKIQLIIKTRIGNFSDSDKSLPSLSGFLSESQDIIPSNIDTDALAENLTEGVNDSKKLEHRAINHQPSVGSLVWAHLGKVKHYPAMVTGVFPLKPNELSRSDFTSYVDIIFYDKDKTYKRVQDNQVVLFGISASVDKTRISQVLVSKSYNRNVKKEFLDSYHKAKLAIISNVKEKD